MLTINLYVVYAPPIVLEMFNHRPVYKPLTTWSNSKKSKSNVYIVDPHTNFTSKTPGHNLQS